MKKNLYYNRFLFTSLWYLLFLLFTSFVLGPLYEGLRRGDFHKHYQIWLNNDLRTESLFFMFLIAILFSKMTLASEKRLN
ncbi:MAG TPA: hypothetical protein DIW54_06335 [Chitinophagaceae bacterium]|nr:hypothetical protein [Chitinophagaceae bacterium]HCT22958.1 hypothetical protein [Chitinophagaceae bacterium]